MMLSQRNKGELIMLWLVSWGLREDEDGKSRRRNMERRARSLARASKEV